MTPLKNTDSGESQVGEAQTVAFSADSELAGYCGLKAMSPRTLRRPGMAAGFRLNKFSAVPRCG